MKETMITLFALGLLILLIPAFAQKDNPIVGTWDLVSRTVDGKDNVPSANGAPAGVKPGKPRQIFAADGNYIYANISTGRPVLTKPANEWTREDFASYSWGVFANHGTYSISSDKLTLEVLAAVSPSNEGKTHVGTFRFDAGDLIITSTESGPKVEQRWRRAK